MIQIYKFFFRLTNKLGSKPMRYTVLNHLNLKLARY